MRNQGTQHDCVFEAHEGSWLDYEKNVSADVVRWSSVKSLTLNHEDDDNNAEWKKLDCFPTLSEVKVLINEWGVWLLCCCCFFNIDNSIVFISPCNSQLFWISEELPFRISTTKTIFKSWKKVFFCTQINWSNVILQKTEVSREKTLLNEQRRNSASCINWAFLMLTKKISFSP